MVVMTLRRHEALLKMYVLNVFDTWKLYTPINYSSITPLPKVVNASI